MRAVLLLASFILAACTGDKAPDAGTSRGLTTADLMGSWGFEVRPLDRDTVLVTGTLVGAGDPPTWTMTITGSPGRQSAVEIRNDTVFTTTGPYPSPLQPGVMVTTTGTYQLETSQLVGAVTSHYDGITTADSVRKFRVTMTRVR